MTIYRFHNNEGKLRSYELVFPWDGYKMGTVQTMEFKPWYSLLAFEYYDIYRLLVARMTTRTAPSNGSTAKFIFQARIPTTNPVGPPRETNSEEEGSNEVWKINPIVEEVVSTPSTWKGEEKVK